MIPDHYKLDPSPQKVISKWGLTFAAGNVIKYMVRAGRKSGVPVLVDWRKALDNLLIVGLERGLRWAEVASEASASCGWASKVWAGPIAQADLDAAAEIVVEDADTLRARVAELETSLAFEKATIAVNKLTIYRLEGQVAALADALAGMTRSVCRCYEHNDALGDAMDLAKVVLRATGRKP